MLYMFYRYIIGLALAFTIGVSLILVFYLGDPVGFPALGVTRTFGPILSLLYIFSIILSVLTILFTHPFITDGEETLQMQTPLSHASIQGNIILIFVLAFLQVSALDSAAAYAPIKVIGATAFLLKIAVVSLATSIMGFFALKYRAKVMRRRGHETVPFCVDSSFKGL
jgi:hypothetical protein